MLYVEFEYKTFKCGMNALESELNKFGKEGWFLFQIILTKDEHATAILQRQIPLAKQKTWWKK